MTVVPAGLSTTVAGGAAPDPVRDAQLRNAAQQFEGLFLQQLVSTMRESAAMFEGTGGDMYGEMFDQQMGETLAASGGVGMADVLARAMGASPIAPSARIAPMLPLDLGPVLDVRPPSGAAIEGATGDLQRAADELLPPSGVAPQWGRDGSLTPADLVSPVSDAAALLSQPGSEAASAVRSHAYQGYYKCNLFAFELARRAGFEVPFAQREHGWGYPGTDAVTTDASDGSLRGDWGRVATSASAEAIDSSIVRGEGAFLLSGSGADGHHGHMGIIERVRGIERDASGAITSITFDGWEGRAQGAMHLVERTWTTVGHGGSEGARRGLTRIEVIELERPEASSTAPSTEDPLGGPQHADESADLTAP